MSELYREESGLSLWGTGDVFTEEYLHRCGGGAVHEYEYEVDRDRREGCAETRAFEEGTVAVG